MNKDIYKRAINQIHASEKLKNNTFEKIYEKENTKKTKRNFILFKQLSTVCAVCLVMLFVVTFYLNNDTQDDIINLNTTKENTASKMENNDLPRFENIEQLKRILKKNAETSNKGTIIEDMFSPSDIIADSAVQEQESTNKDYSETNIQVQGVDEADTIKTDGNYIYYVADDIVYIINSNNLNIESKIQYNNDKERFYPREIYIKDNKLVILGNSTEHKEQQENDTEFKKYYARISTNYFAKAIVFDITNKEEPIELRQVSLDGNYSNSRMIGDNLYFISTKYAYYYNGMKDEEILPILRDTASDTKEMRIACTDIAYLEDTDNASYMLVAGFNINNNQNVNIETLFGANNTVYCSQNNLYIAQTIYKDGLFSSTQKSVLYKFNLKNSNIKLQCKGEVKGDLNDQFSMDEYDGNLRIATTDNYSNNSTNQLYILDENLNQIGKVENLAKGEKIYSVRFVGKIGYVVTFKEIDPLFVIDLSDPTNPIVKGKLKIPGYSSYLHPYDENHIIGIGYNTESNGFGGVTNSNMKMSMFDVSDLENPKEIFHVDIGNDYAYSEIINNHKALFYHKDKNLIGFPVTYREYNASRDKNGFVLCKINLEKGFEKYGEILEDIDYKTKVDRVIYIDDILYTLSDTKIVTYSLTSLEKLNEKDY